jgi:photosystem II stability/assembly factor-like uncharacterized protein
MQRTKIRAAILAAALLGALAPAVPHVRARQARATFPATAIYAGTAQGKVFRSTDGGDSWQEADSGLPALAITAIAVAPGGTNRVYLGTQGGGTFVTSDGGKTWRTNDGGDAGLARASVRAMVVDPFDGSYVFVLTAPGFVYTSSDGGLDWSRHALGGNGAPTSLGISPERPMTLLAGTASGAEISTDGGYTWQAVTGIKAGVRVNGFAFSANDAHVAYAATSDGVYAAFNGGQGWGPVNHTQRGMAIQSVAVDPQDDTSVIAGGSDGTIYRSTDGGVTWNSGTDTNGASANALTFVPGNPNGIIAATSDGSTLYASSDGGSTWQSATFAATSTDSVISIGGTERGSLPTDPVDAPPVSATVKYFPQSHHTVRDNFLYIYQHYGGLKLFGLPLTEQFNQDGQKVQYFERVEFILQSRTLVFFYDLGDSVTADRYFPTVPSFKSTGTRMYFSSTHHSLAGRFLTYWKAHDGENTFGDPISEPFYEQNGDGTGRQYLVQYFDAARMEYHPELAGTAFEVSLGLLGQQVLKQRGWL